MKMSRKSLMKHANDIAKKIVSRTKNYTIALKYALKYCWKQISDDHEKTRFTKASVRSAVYELTHKPYDHKWDKTWGIYNFFLSECLENGDLGEQEYQVINGGMVDTCYPVRYTKKAVDVCFITPFGRIYLWAPLALAPGFK